MKNQEAVTATNPIIPTSATARATCSHCGSIHFVKDGRNARGEQKIRCKACGKGSIMAIEAKRPFEENYEVEEIDVTPRKENNMSEPTTEPTTEVTAPVSTPAPKKAKALKLPLVEVPKTVQTKAPRQKKVNDIYERGLYTVTRMMDESGLEGVPLRKFKFAAQKALAANEIAHEVEQLNGAQWRRVIKMDDAHKFMASVIGTWQPS